MSLVQQITTAFVEKQLDLTERERYGVGPNGQGWETLPEFEQVRRLRDANYDETDVRLFLTFTAAMDRARNSAVLWTDSANLLLKDRWPFEPSAIAKRSFIELGELLSNTGVSQRHTQDVAAWRTIGEVLADPNRVPSVYNVIYGNGGDAAALLEAVKRQSGARGKWKLFPNLGGLKISPMWVRMLVSPGEVPVTNLHALRVAVDVQVHRVTYFLGFTNKKPGPGAINDKFTAIVQKAWQQGIEDAVAPAFCEPLNGTAGALDPALWFIGKWGCSFCEKEDRWVPHRRLL